jgi:hypothetical protein
MCRLWQRERSKPDRRVLDPKKNVEASVQLERRENRLGRSRSEGTESLLHSCRAEARQRAITFDEDLRK